MTTRLRQRLYNLKSFDSLAYDAVLGKWSKDEYSEGDGVNPDVTYKIVFADTGNISSDSPGEIWPLTGTNMTRTKTAETLSIVSSSTQDDTGGSGINAVFIEGLDGDFSLQSELVLLDGTSAVTSANSYIHVHEANCLNIGTTGTTNAGNITMTQSSSGGTLAYILAGDSITKHSQFVVPAGYNAIMLGGYFSTYRASGSGVRRSQIDLTIVPLDGGAGDGIIYQTLKLGNSSETTDELRFAIPLVIGEKVFLRPVAKAEANNTRVSVQYSLLLVKETIDIDSVI